MGGGVVAIGGMRVGKSTADLAGDAAGLRETLPSRSLLFVVSTSLRGLASTDEALSTKSTADLAGDAAGLRETLPSRSLVFVVSTGLRGLASTDEALNTPVDRLAMAAWELISSR